MAGDIYLRWVFCKELSITFIFYYLAKVRAKVSKCCPLTFSRTRDLSSSSSFVPEAAEEPEIGRRYGLMGCRAIGIQPIAEARTAGSQPPSHAIADPT